LQLSCSIYHVSPRISHKWWLSKRCRPRNIFYCGGEGAQRRNAGDTAIKCGSSQRAGSVMRRVVCLVPGQSGVSERDFGPDPVGRYQLPMAETAQSDHEWLSEIFHLARHKFNSMPPDMDPPSLGFLLFSTSISPGLCPEEITVTGSTSSSLRSCIGLPS
jgi:hypothetical protein